MPRKKIEAPPEFPSECRLILESTREAVDRLDHRLFGNGQPGVVADLRAEVDAVKEKQSQIEADVETRHQVNLNNAKWQKRLIKIAIAFIAVMPILSGSGVVSLQNAPKLLENGLKLLKAFMG